MTLSPQRMTGVFTDLVTPFRHGALDLIGLKTLVEWQVRSGVSGLVVCGEGGEAPVLNDAERVAVISTTLEVTAGTVPVLVGTGTNATERTIALTREARALGADAAVVVVPYYSKPTQEGLFRHVEAVAIAVDLPLIIVNRPRHTAIDVSPALLERFAGLSGIVGFADYAGDISRPLVLREQDRRRIPRNGMPHGGLPVYSGDDRTALALGLMGAQGTFSLAANVAPRLVVAMHHAFHGGNVSAARTLQQTLYPLFIAIDAEQAVAATKQALAFVLGLAPDVRLPLTEVEQPVVAEIRQALSLLAVPAKGLVSGDPSQRRPA